MPSAIKNWIRVRFVLLCEIVGYIISFCVLGFSIYSMMVSREILANVGGELEFEISSVTIPSEALLLDVQAEDRSPVVMGAPLFSVVTDPEEIATELVLRKLYDAESKLVDAEIVDSDPLISIREGIASIPKERKTVRIDSPTTGILRMSSPESLDEPVFQPKVPLARIYDTKSLGWRGSAENRSLKRPIERGQVARLTLPGSTSEIVGEVVEFETDDSMTTFSVSFNDALNKAPNSMLEYLKEPVLEGADSITVDIVVGHRSLFRELFGKR